MRVKTVSDPIGLAGGLNTFGYVGENPVGFTDPFGLDMITVSANFIFPQFISDQISKVESMSGFHAGIAVEFPGYFGGEFDFAGFFGPNFSGVEVGFGKATLALGYDFGTVCYLAEPSVDISALLLTNELGFSVDTETLELTGVHIAAGLAPSKIFTSLDKLTKRNGIFNWFVNNLISQTSSTNVVVGSVKKGQVTK